MPNGIQGMINLNSHIVAPQVSGENKVDASNCKIVESKRQLREERKSKCNLNFPPLQSVSFKTFKAHRNETTSTKTVKSTISDKTP